MSEEHGVIAAQTATQPATTGVLGLLLVLVILRLVILLGWRDGGRTQD